MSNSRNVASPWPAVKPRVLAVTDMLMGLPSCNVWCHEKVLHKLCKVSEGPAFGQRKSFNAFLVGISKGDVGNKKGGNFTKLIHCIPGFDREGSTESRIRY